MPRDILIGGSQIKPLKANLSPERRIIVAYRYYIYTLKAKPELCGKAKLQKKFSEWSDQTPHHALRVYHKGVWH